MFFFLSCIDLWLLSASFGFVARFSDVGLRRSCRWFYMNSTVRWIYLHKVARWLEEYTCDFATRVACVFIRLVSSWSLYIYVRHHKQAVRMSATTTSQSHGASRIRKERVTRTRYIDSIAMDLGVFFFWSPRPRWIWMDLSSSTHGRFALFFIFHVTSSGLQPFRKLRYYLCANPMTNSLRENGYGLVLVEEANVMVFVMD